MEQSNPPLHPQDFFKQDESQPRSRPVAISHVEIYRDEQSDNEIKPFEVELIPPTNVKPEKIPSLSTIEPLVTIKPQKKLFFVASADVKA